MSTERKSALWNLPNAISLYRILAVPLLLTALGARDKKLFAWLLLVSLVSDIADGLVARLFSLRTELGARLDSLGDMGTYTAAALGLFVFEGGFIRDHYGPILLVLSLYILEVLLALWRYGRISSFHTVSGRIAAYAQGIFITALFLFGYQTWLFSVALVLSIIAYLEDIVIVFLLSQWRTDVKGLYWILRT